MTEPTTLPARKDVPPSQTWDLESIFPSVEAWGATCQEIEGLLPDLRQFQGRLSQSAALLADCFELSERISRLMSKVFVYANLESAADSLDQAAAARAGQARSLMSRAGAASAFIDPELMSIGFDLLFRWVDAEPRLAIYRHYLDKLQKQQQHVRSGEVEEVLALSTDTIGTASSTASILTNADLRFSPAHSASGDELEVGQSSIAALVTHPDRQVRRTAWENYADGYLTFKNTLANCLIAAVKRDVFNARVRAYSTSLEASLAPNFIPLEVFHNLIEVFKRNLPTWQRYWQLRRRALGYDRLHVYDIKAPLTTSKPSVSFTQAVDWITAGMAPMGDEYVRVLRQGCQQERWVDYACNKGKREGAFSSGAYDTHPFIMMSYNDDLFSLSTLAHELGHSMHSYYSRRTQPYIYSRYSLFVAEVASNFNQAMVRDYLFKNQSDPGFQVALIEEAMSNYHRYFFIMPTLARFELEMHDRLERGAPLNADGLIALMADLFKEGYGDEVEFDHDRIGITWAQFSHLYMNFYVYQYATGISGAHALAHNILEGTPGAAEKYLIFLKAGGSLYPLDALRMAGVDLTSPEPVEQAFAVLADLVGRLEKLI